MRQGARHRLRGGGRLAVVGEQHPGVRPRDLEPVAASASSETVASVGCLSSEPKRGPNGRPDVRGRSSTSIVNSAGRAVPRHRERVSVAVCHARLGFIARATAAAGLLARREHRPCADPRQPDCRPSRSRLSLAQRADVRRRQDERMRLGPHYSILVGDSDSGTADGTSRSEISRLSLDFRVPRPSPQPRPSIFASLSPEPRVPVCEASNSNRPGATAAGFAGLPSGRDKTLSFDGNAGQPGAGCA